jgi:uncharacterized phage-associated protein
MIRFHFNSVKTTQAACYLLKRKGGTMSKGFLLKMLYLADRELLQKRGQPITGDRPVSMKNGPVLSKTYDLTKGGAVEHRAYWEKFITNAPSGYTDVSLIQEAGTDYLSKIEIRVLDEVFDKFRNFSWRQLVDYCHKLPEWKNPGESSFAIDFEQILSGVGKSGEEISEIENQADESRILDAILKNYAVA